ncbi:cytochrome-c oxidase, cbb3-type subunit II [Bosea sp. (in: a-proteobacteria)]|uniref:cytochrome-c oxidase, cbb3-type subunit II n=1 Tax=Bosea sp. (in: a-proteobacteria) TaxID=1871050 RepID=UPI003B3BB7A1
MSNIATQAGRRSLWSRHKVFETNSILLIIGVLLVISVGGLVEIAPLFYLKNTIEKVEGMRPYTPLELAGRAIYVREGCYNCHSQMIRPLRDEVERYGHYSLAAESMYDKPFQWGSKRIGPDLARVGGKYSDEWHRLHLTDPRLIVPQSIMPGYAFLFRNELKAGDIAAEMSANRLGGVPYTDAMIGAALVDLKAQAAPDHPGQDDLAKRYPKAQARDFDGDPGRITEADALIAYLQGVGTLVDFKLYDDKANIR